MEPFDNITTNEMPLNETTANETTSTEDPVTGQTFYENLTAAMVIMVLSGTGLTAYIIVIISLIRYFSHFHNSFYSFLLSLAFSDSVMLCLFFFYSVPATILQSPFLGDTVDMLFGALCNMVYFAGLTCIMIIAVNRYWAVCRYATLEKVYSKRNVKVLLGLIWLVGVCSCIPQLLPCCTLHYYYDAYTWGYDMALRGNQVYIWYDRFMNSLTFGTLIFSYVMIVLQQKKKLNMVLSKNTARSRVQQARRQKAELRLAFQFSLVAIVLIVFGLSFTIIPELTLKPWYLFITSVLYIINNSVNPFLYLTFNEAIRKAVICLLYREKFQAGVGTVVGFSKVRSSRRLNTYVKSAAFVSKLKARKNKNDDEVCVEEMEMEDKKTDVLSSS